MRSIAASRTIRASRPAVELVELVERPDRPVTLTYPEAASRFVAFMREHGVPAFRKGKQPGIYTDVELQAFIEWWLADENVVRMPYDLLAKHIKLQLGVRFRRQRLAHLGDGRGRVSLYLIRDHVDPVVLASQEQQHLKAA